MTFKSSILVLANQTALSAGLEAVLRQRASARPTMFTLVIPLGRSADAHRTAGDIAARLRQAGLEVKGLAGSIDPLCAVVEAWNPAEFDEIIVSTLPKHLSKWLKLDLPHRVERATGKPVTHVEASETKVEA